MPTPSELKTVQARILAYVQECGWTLVSREEAERRRGFDPEWMLRHVLELSNDNR
jgi:type I restriction enzyme, R subunit